MPKHSDNVIKPTGMTPYNPDVDPTRLQPYGNPHARIEGIGVRETEGVRDLRLQALEEMSDEGVSVEDVKGAGGGRRRGEHSTPEGEDVVPMKGSDRLYIDRATGKVLNESGRVEAVLASPGSSMNPSKSKE